MSDHIAAQRSVKTPYSRPELTVFGSVRNATGGSTGLEGDNGPNGMMANTMMG